MDMTYAHPTCPEFDDENAVFAWHRNEIDSLRRSLAGISEEMGLPPTIGPAKGDLKRILDQGKAAIDALRDAPRVVSEEADFDAMTWTFQIGRDCRTGPGVYALVWVKSA